MNYCSQWSVYKHKPFEPITENEAKVRHQSGEVYVAYEEDSNGVVFTIEIDKFTIVVNFFDEQQRNDLSYAFKYNPEFQKYWLRDAMHWEFLDNTRQDTFVRTTYNFIGDQVFVDKFSTATQSSEKTEFDNDNSGNWEMPPKFGDYSNFTRRER